MGQQIDWVLLARYVAGECTVSERIDVQARLGEDPGLADAVRRLESYWAGQPETDEDVEKLEASWSRMKERLGEIRESSAEIDTSGNLVAPAEKASKMTRRAVANDRSAARRFGLANRTPRVRRNLSLAVVAVSIVSGLLVWQAIETFSARSEHGSPMREVATTTGQRATFALADGTTITLNAESRIRLPEVFAPDIREVFLDGEAFFEVESIPDRPFVVRVRGGNVKVLGTDFSIQSYDNEPSTFVVVAEGRVAVTTGGKDETVEVSPGIRAELTAAGVLTDSVDVATYTGWIDGRLVFDEARLSEVARVLERWYGTRVEFSEEILTERRVTANLKGRYLRDVLDVLATTAGLEYEFDGEMVLFAAG